MRFMLFVIDDSTSTATAEEMRSIDAFNERLVQGGHWVAAGGLSDPAAATLIDARAGRTPELSGSLFDAPEFYSGFWILYAQDREQALELAREASAACNRRLELRPFL